MNLTALIRAARKLTGRWIPPADDNQYGHNTGDLWTCRLITRLPLTDPDIARRANTYLRRKEGEQQ